MIFVMGFILLVSISLTDAIHVGHYRVDEPAVMRDQRIAADNVYEYNYLFCEVLKTFDHTF